MTQPDITTPWHPMSDPVDLKTIGKLSEELAEAIIAVAEFQRAYDRSAAPRVPVLRQVQKDLVAEFGDVLANADLVRERFDLFEATIEPSPDVLRYSPTRIIIELAALSNVVARCIIQGLDGIDPTEGDVNRDRLARSLKITCLCLMLFAEQEDLLIADIQARAEKKKAYLRQVHAGA